MKMIFVVIAISLLLGGAFFFLAYHFLIKKGKNFPMIHFKGHKRKENSTTNSSSYKKQRKE